MSAVFCVRVSLAAVEVRLEDGSHHCEGRLAVKHQGTWGTVNVGYSSLNNAVVLCRQLGCGDLVDVVRSTRFGQGSGPIWLVDLSCSGTELTVNDCNYRHLRNHSDIGLSHDWDIAIICSGKAYLVWTRLPSRNSLRLIPRITDAQDHRLYNTLGKDPATHDS